MVVAVTREGLDGAGFRREAARCADGSAARRMLALAQVMDGASRGEAARLAGMDRQTLRDWVHRYNSEGLAGLWDRPHPGPPTRLTPEQLAKLTAIVEAGPNPDKHKVIRWRRVDLQAVIEELFNVKLHERSVGKILKKLNFRKITVRPQHPKSNPEVQEEFKKTLPAN